MNWEFGVSRCKLSHLEQIKIRSYSIAQGFPGSSVGKESACNAGDPCLIPGQGRSPGEGIGYLLLYSWASLVAQLVKNLPAMWETWVQSLGWEDPLEKGKATCSSILAWRIPWTVHGVAKGRTQLSKFQYSTGNFTQSPRISHNENDFKVYVCV